MSLIFGTNNTPEDNSELTLSMESMTLISEAILLENLSPEELDAFLSDRNELVAAEQDEVIMEKSIVRLDKAARISQAQKIATFSIAKEKNDPLFKKLLTVWRMERFIEGQLFKKYGAQAGRQARQMVSKQGNSRSNIVKKAATTAQRQLGTRPPQTNPGAMPRVNVPSVFR